MSIFLRQSLPNSELDWAHAIGDKVILKEGRLQSVKARVAFRECSQNFEKVYLCVASVDIVRIFEGSLDKSVPNSARVDVAFLLDLSHELQMELGETVFSHHLAQSLLVFSTLNQLSQRATGSVDWRTLVKSEDGGTKVVFQHSHRVARVVVAIIFVLTVFPPVAGVVADEGRKSEGVEWEEKGIESATFGLNLRLKLQRRDFRGQSRCLEGCGRWLHHIVSAPCEAETDQFESG